MSLELIFLGTGTSAGVPMIGCRCEVCTSDDPRDHRMRPSVLVRYPANGDADNANHVHVHDENWRPPQRDPKAPRTAPTHRQFLIDTTPEMRLQAIRYGLDRIDGVIYTHAHADHIFGLDDLRRFNAVMESTIDIYAEQPTIDTLHRMFPYIFESHKNINQTWVAKLVVNPITPQNIFTLHGAKWTPLRLMHGRQPILGFRIDLDGPEAGSIAYCTDVSHVPEETIPLLADLDVLVIDGLRFTPHPTHMTVEQAVAVAQRVKPRQTYLTHIAHDIGHAKVDPTLPENVNLAYDGLRVTATQPHVPGYRTTTPSKDSRSSSNDSG